MTCGGSPVITCSSVTLGMSKARKESLRDKLEHDENSWLELIDSINKEIGQLAGLQLRAREDHKEDHIKNRKEICKLKAQIKKSNQTITELTSEIDVLREKTAELDGRILMLEWP